MNPHQNPRKRKRRKLVQEDNDSHKSLYKNHNHGNQALASLNKMRGQKSLCDVVLVVDDGSELPVHRSFLAACSKYFLAILRNFKARNQSRIKIQGVDHSTLKLLIDYAYTTEIHVTEENVRLLLPAAHLLQFPNVKKACCDFLLAQLHPSNCLGIRTFVEIHGCSELLENINSYIEKHFSDIVEGEEFLKLDQQQVAQLIRSDHLMVQTEEVVFESVISWIRADLKIRKSFLVHLMDQVRLPLLSSEYLSQRVKKEPLVKESSECQNFLSEAFKYHSLKSEGQSSLLSSKTKPRCPRSLRKVLSVVGGELDTGRVSSAEYFDFEEGRWHKMSGLPTRIYGAGSTVLEDRLYVVGGRNRHNFSYTVNAYDSNTDQWSKCARTIEKRLLSGVAVLGKLLYAVGGIDGRFSLNTVEVYDPLVNEWREITSMSTSRGKLGVGVVKDRLYAIGGYDPFLGYLSSVECYDPEKNEWKFVSGMSTKRAGLGIGVLNGIIYAVGGSDGKSVLESVEAYDPETNQWKPIPDMIECRTLAGVVAFNGLLYVVGGENETSTFSSVEVYSPVKNSWTMFPSSMSIPRYSASVAIIEKPQALPKQL